MRKRRKRKKLQERTSDSGSDQENIKEVPRGWFLNFAPEPTKEMCLSDNEVLNIFSYTNSFSKHLNYLFQYIFFS